MKKYILILSALLFTFTISGQTFTLRAGASLSKLNWENSMVRDKMFRKNILGFDASLGIEYLNSKYFNLASNLGFIQKGGKDSIMVTGVYGENGPMEEFKIMLNYLTVNTVFEFKVPVKNIITPYVLIGPRLDYLVSYKERGNFIRQFDDTGKLNKIIYGAIAGVGVKFSIWKIQLGIEGDYYLNINKLVDYTSEYGTTNKISDNTFTLNFLVGYKL